MPRGFSESARQTPARLRRPSTTAAEPSSEIPRSTTGAPRWPFLLETGQALSSDARVPPQHRSYARRHTATSKQSVAAASSALRDSLDRKNLRDPRQPLKSQLTIVGNAIPARRARHLDAIASPRHPESLRNARTSTINSCTCSCRPRPRRRYAREPADSG